jgi:hypothetical protein
MAKIILVSGLLMFLFSVIGVQLFRGTFFYCTDTLKTTQASCKGCFFTYPYGDLNRPVIATREWKQRDFHFDNIFAAAQTLFIVSTFEGWPLILKWAIDSTEKDSGPEWDNRPAVALFFVAFIVVVAFFMVNIFVGFVVITFQKEESLASAHLDKNQKACVEFALRARPHKLHCPTNPKQYALWQFVNSNGFEYSILFLISLNTILMGIKYHGQSQTYSSVLEYINMLFTVVYTFECILKLFAWSPKYYFYEIWNVFDFIIVIGSLLDVTLHLSMGQNKYHGIDVKFLRMFRAFRLVKVLHRQHGIRTLLWTFFKSFQTLPWVLLLIALLFYIYAVIGMQVFGRIRLDPNTTIYRYNNFQTFFQALMVLFRVSTGENWQKIMISCANFPDVKCAPESDSQGECGSWFSYVYFMSFVSFISFVMINLFLAVIMDNFEYLTRDHSILGPQHLEEFVQTWAKFDPEGRGEMKHKQVMSLLQKIEPPLGFGKCCPYRLACRRMISMDMPMKDDNTVTFNATLFAVVRTALNIKTGDNRQSANNKLRSIIKKLWPSTSKEILDNVLPLDETDGQTTVGRVYAVALIQSYFQGFRKRRQERQQRQEASVNLIRSGVRQLHTLAPNLKRAISGKLFDSDDDVKPSGCEGSPEQKKSVFESILNAVGINHSRESQRSVSSLPLSPSVKVPPHQCRQRATAVGGSLNSEGEDHTGFNVAASASISSTSNYLSNFRKPTFPTPAITVSMAASESPPRSPTGDHVDTKFADDEEDESMTDKISDDSYYTPTSSPSPVYMEMPVNDTDSEISDHNSQAIQKWEESQVDPMSVACCSKTLSLPETGESLFTNGLENGVSVIEKILIEGGCGGILDQSDVEAVEQELVESCRLTSNQLEEILQEAEAENCLAIAAPQMLSYTTYPHKNAVPCLPDVPLSPSAEFSMQSSGLNQDLDETDQMRWNSGMYPSILPSLDLTSSSEDSCVFQSTCSVDHSSSSLNSGDCPHSALHHRTIWRETSV